MAGMSEALACRTVVGEMVEVGEFWRGAEADDIMGCFVGLGVNGPGMMDIQGGVRLPEIAMLA